MATRYIWREFNANSSIDYLPQWDSGTKAVSSENGEIGSADNPLPFAIDQKITCVKTENDSEDSAATVSARLYYKIDPTPEGANIVDYTTHPYILYSDDSYREDYLGCTEIFNAEQYNDDGGFSAVSIVYKDLINAATMVYSKGDTFRGFLTGANRDRYDDGYFDERNSWIEYYASDNIDLAQTDIRFVPGSIPSVGGTIDVQITPKVSMIESLISYDWWYSDENGAEDSWVPFTTNSTLTSYMINVDSTSTGFCVRIQAHDDTGYVGDVIESSKIYVIENFPPNSPKFKSVPSNIIIGEQFNIEWFPATDPDGQIYGYTLERLINNSGKWELIYHGTELTTYDILDTGMQSVKYRIAAYDDKFVYSEYTESNLVQTQENQPPHISGENENLGVVNEVWLSFTVTDPNDEVTIRQYLDTTLLSTYRNVEGVAYTIHISGDEFKKLDNGIHVVKVTATDSYGAMTTRTWVFKKRSSTTSESDDVQRYQFFRKMEDGNYKPVRLMNDSSMILRMGEDLNVEESLEKYLPELRPSDDPPYDISPGKIVVGLTKMFAKGANGELLRFEQPKPPYVAQDRAPADTSILWIDTSDRSNPLLRYWNGSAWVLLKSIYSGGTRDW